MMYVIKILWEKLSGYFDSIDEINWIAIYLLRNETYKFFNISVFLENSSTYESKRTFNRFGWEFRHQNYYKQPFIMHNSIRTNPPTISRHFKPGSSWDWSQWLHGRYNDNVDKKFF